MGKKKKKYTFLAGRIRFEHGSTLWMHVYYLTLPDGVNF